MCAIYLGTRLLCRDRAMVNALGAAALGLLVFDPRQLFTASFQMTFICVLIVGAIGLPMIERTSAFYRRGIGKLGLRRLQPVAAAARGAVPPGLSVHRWPPGALFSPTLVATTCPLRRQTWFLGIRSFFPLPPG